MKLENHALLKHYTTFGVEAYADRVLEIEQENELYDFFSSAYAQQPYMLIGEGSNLLFVNDYHGTLVKMQTKGIVQKENDGKNVIVAVKAGEVWDDFVRYALQKSWYGLENLALIPGKVGSSPVQNIGAYGREAKDFIYKVHAYETASGRVRTFTNAECEFAYRNSIFKNKLKGQYVILEVEFLLSLVPDVNIQYEDVKKRLGNACHITPKQVYDAVVQIRREKLPDPQITGNAGSFFKNPVVSLSQYRQLKQQYDLKMYPVSEEVCKLSAAELITVCGWRGKRTGNVGVHPNQALVLVNYGGAKGAEVYHLAKQIQADVNNRFGVMLDMEVNVI
ncbi:MAG: UDP-N-acetylmuramate dehydrogenase [Bacteroidales bacterium]|nr:UDP-N-acetylmuramate dehydrogenase [Bacteroidales bacterium]